MELAAGISKLATSNNDLATTYQNVPQFLQLRIPKVVLQHVEEIYPSLNKTRTCTVHSRRKRIKTSNKLSKSQHRLACKSRNISHFQRRDGSKGYSQFPHYDRHLLMENKNELYECEICKPVFQNVPEPQICTCVNSERWLAFPRNTCSSDVNMLQDFPSSQNHLTELSTCANKNTVAIKTQSVNNVKQTPLELREGSIIVRSKPNGVIRTAHNSFKSAKSEFTDSGNGLSGSYINNKNDNIDTRRASFTMVLDDLGEGEIEFQVSSENVMSVADATTSRTLEQCSNSFIPKVICTKNVCMTKGQERKGKGKFLRNREVTNVIWKNREEYIQCLEKQVTLLENQKQTLLQELQSIRSLYCQLKAD